MASPQSYLPLKGKLAVITGGSRGIGAAIARNLASKGADLLLNFTSTSSLELAIKLKEEIATEIVPTSHVEIFQADVGTPEGTQALVKYAAEKFKPANGEKLQIDIVVNNAGVAGNMPLEDVKIEEFNRQYRVNVLGPILLMQAVLPYLPRDRSGRIVNLSSVSSSQGFIGQTIYGGTKAAVEAMTRTWSRELAERATVNAVNPGPVTTDMYHGTSSAFQNHLRPFLEHTPLSHYSQSEQAALAQEQLQHYKAAGGRAASADEIAGIVAMLCSKDSAWCTGCVVGANGGMVFSA
ncbi:hypothetical protein RUND412_011213 [Rhizina undulata]